MLREPCWCYNVAQQPQIPLLRFKGGCIQSRDDLQLHNWKLLLHLLNAWTHNYWPLKSKNCLFLLITKPSLLHRSEQSLWEIGSRCWLYAKTVYRLSGRITSRSTWIWKWHSWKLSLRSHCQIHRNYYSNVLAFQLVTSMIALTWLMLSLLGFAVQIDPPMPDVCSWLARFDAMEMQLISGNWKPCFRYVYRTFIEQSKLILLLFLVHKLLCKKNNLNSIVLLLDSDSSKGCA